MAEEIFSPDDLKGLINIDTLAESLVGIIDSIRAGDTKYPTLTKKIQELEKYLDINPKSDLKILQEAYEKIKETSLEIRALLSEIFPQIEKYEDIEYSIYFKGKRYSTNHLKSEWLQKKGSGNLMLSVSAMAKEMQELYNIYGVDKAQSIFENHLQKFQNAIVGTYRGVINNRGAINMGHVTEGFEEHLAQHHTIAYNLYNQIDVFSNFDKSIIAAVDELNRETQNIPDQDWDGAHESIDEAWVHMRHALGVQKGTVAGDVYNRQVKAIQKAAEGKQQEGRIRLERFNVLKTGVRTYCAILDPTVSSIDCAKQIIKYIEEPVRQISSRMINEIAEETVKDFLLEEQDRIAAIKATGSYTGV